MAANVSGPQTSNDYAQAIRQGMIDSASQNVVDAVGNLTNKLASGASESELAAAHAKIASANQNLNSAIAADPTTQNTLNDLNATRAQAISDAAQLPTDSPGRDAAFARVVDANSAYSNALTSAQNNGGVLPGSPPSDPGLPIPPVPPAAGSATGGSADDVLANLRAQQSAQPTPDPSTNVASANSTDTSLPLPPIPPATPPAPTNSVSATNDKLTSVLNSSGSVPATAGSASAQVSVADQRVRLTPKDMSILGGSSTSKSLGGLTSSLPASAAAVLDRLRNAIPSGILSTGNQSASSLLSPLIATQGLMFPYTPQIQYVGTANYGSQNPVHANQDFKFYTNTASTTVQIGGTFTAQTKDEAIYLLATLHFLRTVIKMRFGKGSNIGLPPPVLILNGYGKGIFSNLPVIITNFTMDMPNNVDYVKTTSAGITAWLPVHTTINVTCVVQNTPNKLRTFDWDAFANGSLLSQGGWS